MSQFIECEACRAKPGMPVLCDECLRRRKEEDGKASRKLTNRTVRLTHGGLLLTITTVRGKKVLVTTYVVQDSRPDPRVANPAFSLTKEDGEVYHVAVNEFGPTCDCQDCNYRSRACKHVRSMQAVGLLPR